MPFTTLTRRPVLSWVLGCPDICATDPRFSPPFCPPLPGTDLLDIDRTLPVVEAGFLTYSGLTESDLTLPVAEAGLSTTAGLLELDMPLLAVDPDVFLSAAAALDFLSSFNFILLSSSNFSELDLMLSIVNCRFPLSLVVEEDPCSVITELVLRSSLNCLVDDSPLTAFVSTIDEW